MKKYVKLIAKKSLSLFLAVLMLLSCWVWIAPERAAAEDKTRENGWYYVKVMVDISDTFDQGGAVEHWYKINGYELTVVDKYKLLDTDDADMVDVAFGWVKGFPQNGQFVFHWKANSGGCNGGTGKFANMHTYVQKEDGTWVQITQGGPHAVTVEGGKTIEVDPTDWGGGVTNLPSIQTIKGTPASTASVTVPKLGSNAGDKSVFSSDFGVKYYDQYGVRIIDAAPEIGLKTTSGKDDNFDTTLTKDGSGLWYESGNVKYNENVQTLIPNKSGAKYYLYAHLSHSAGDRKDLLSTITVNYPNYTVSVNPNGGTMGLSDNTTTASTWTFSSVYGQSAAAYPTGGRDASGNFIGATKAGYTFKGFWTAQQPTTGDASVNAYEAAFATPVSSTEFANLGGTTGVGTYFEKDGKKYYNAGKEWDAAKDKEVLGDATFYGWWISQDITVKFYDVDGSYLGTQITKYGKKEAENWYPDPKDGYNAGAYEYQGFAKQWRDITGAVITEGSYTFGDLETLTLTPVYTAKEYKDEYTITFINPVGGNDVAEKYDYRHILGGGEIPTYGIPNAIAYDYGYSYEFAGWSTQVPANGKYHLVAKNDTAFSENTDWVVREDTTYYAVYRSAVKEYVIAFSYTDSTGAEKTDIKYVTYGSAITTPDNVNRTYAKGGYGYTLEGWDYTDKDSITVMLGVDNSLVFNAETVSLAAENLKGETPEKPIVFKANYDEGQPTPYTVTFKYKDANGNDKTVVDEVYHGYLITEDIVDRVDVPEQYDDGEALYTFANRWKVTEGTADKTEYLKDEFTSFGPTSHVTFEAIYGEGVPFYTVTYHDGAKTYSERITAGSTIPAWMAQNGFNDDGSEKMEEYVPADREGATGTYEFVGWFDAEQTDKTYAVTNGTKYTTADTVNGNIDLYSQFIFEPFKFAIKFVNWDGTVLAEGEYEAGQDFKAIYDKAMDTAAKPADATYSYTFIGWDNVVPDTFLCGGKDMTYTAQYKPSYIYYKARWYNDVNAMNSANPEFETIGQDGLLAITSYTYEGAVYAPSVDLTLPTDAPAGETYVFAGWKYLKDGVETDYVRGMTITAGMSFYATYTTVKNAVTVTTVVDGVSTEYKVEYGEKATAVGDPVDGYKDETNHQKFDAWYADAGYETVFDIANTAITENITIYANFKLEAHKMDQKEIISVPTYYTKGSEKVWCACSKEETVVTIDIAELTDTVAPTGTIYLGTQGKWSSTDLVGAAATDNDTVTLYANDDTDIILTINDTGDVSAYNTSGVGKGIAKIQGIISTGVFGADTTEIAGIQTIFEDDSEKLNNTANYVIRLGSYGGLVSGQTYIAYYYAVDKAGNQLNRNVRTAKFIYDNTAPVITIEGDNNAATAKSTVTYCAKATIKGIENDATLMINGETVALTTTGANGLANYTINEAGNYLITVTDKAGNSTSEKIIVAADHDEITTEVPVTCEADGYKTVTCVLCAKELEKETYKSEGHKYGDEQTVAPTCEEDGYKVKVCSVCGDRVVTEDVTLASKGHQHATDTNGDIIYTVVTPATCSVKGKAVSNCTVCGGDTKTKDVDLDKTNGHLYGGTKVLKATCDKDGQTYKTCKYCFETETIDTLPKLEHKDTGRYTKVTTAATCYSEGVETTYCKGCDAVMGTAPVAKIAHTLILVTYDEDDDKTTEYPNGYMQYECQVDGCNHTEGKQAIAVKATYTVTFKGAGAEGADLTITKTEGETIAAGAVADQTKAQDEYNKYTFVGWKGSDGKVVKLPVKVTKNETYTAEFTATKRTYTHIFKVNENDQTDFATIVGAYNDENKKPLAEPKKEATDTVTYEFDGWEIAGNVVKDFTMTENKTFVAKFKEIPVKYSVIFYDSDRTTPLYNVKVDGGANVAYAGKEPAKTYDATYHYTFAGWEYGSSTLALNATVENITETTRLYAKYTAVAHTFETVVDADKTWAATCTTAGQKTEKCACGYEKVTVESALGHNYSVELSDGSKQCSRCDDTIAPEAKMVTITFVNDDNKVLKTVEVEEGKTYTFTAPAKESTDAANYSFTNWVDADDAEVCRTAEITVTAGAADATYKAVYTAETRYYNVVFVNADGKQLYFVSAAYGSAVPAYEGAKPKTAYDADNHYVWANSWKLVAGKSATEVKGDTRLMAEYTAVAHSFVETETEATCQQTGGLKKVCSCGLAYAISEETPKLDHEIGTVVSYTAPQLGVAGSRTYICSMCEKEFTESIPALASANINIQVYNYDGELAKSATVELWYTVDGELVQYVANANGDYLTENGLVSVVVPAEYSGWRAKVYLLEGGSYNEEVKTGTLNVIGAPKAEEPEDTDKDDCSCSCHKNTFWGFIFRLFQKIVKLFAGKAKCCSNPDSRI